MSKLVNGSCRFHPDFFDGKSKIQSTMLGYMHQWVEGLGFKKRSKLGRLTKQSVREHKNVLRQGEGGVSQALVNPLGLPTLEDLKDMATSPPPSVGASIVGTHEGKPIYFSADAYGKGGDISPVPRGIYSPPSTSSSYSPSITDSEVSSQEQQVYQWTPGLPREGGDSVSQSTADFCSVQRSNSSSATSSFYSPPLDPPQSTEDFYNARPNLQRSVTTGYTPPQGGFSQPAQSFYSSPGSNPLQFQSPVLGSPQQPGDHASKNPFYRQMSAPSRPQSQSHGMDFYARSPPQGPQPPYNPHPPQIQQMSSEAASFYASPPLQSLQPVSQPRGQKPPAIQQVANQDGQTDPLVELAASLRKF